MSRAADEVVEQHSADGAVIRVVYSNWMTQFEEITCICIDEVNRSANDMRGEVMKHIIEWSGSTPVVLNSLLPAKLTKEQLTSLSKDKRKMKMKALWAPYKEAKRQWKGEDKKKFDETVKIQYINSLYN